jgi:hypothetical protein
MTNAYLQPFTIGTTVHDHVKDILGVQGKIDCVGISTFKALLESSQVAPFIAPELGPEGERLMQELSDARTAYEGHAAHAHQAALVQETDRAWALLESKLGLKEGDTVTWTDASCSRVKQSFTLEDASLEAIDGHPHLTAICMSGRDASRDARKSHMLRRVKVRCFQAAATAMGLPSKELKRPCELTLAEIQDELRGADELIERNPSRYGWRRTTNNELLRVLELLKSDDFHADYILNRAKYRESLIYLEVDITSKENLVVEWFDSTKIVCREHSGSTHYRPNRLLQISVADLQSFYDRGASYLPGVDERLRDLHVYAVVAVFRAFMEKMSATYKVARPPHWLVAHQPTGRLGLATVKKVYFGLQRLDPEIEASELEQLCQYQEEGLALLTPYDWRNPSVKSDEAWAPVLVDAGAPELAVPFGAELRQNLVEFYQWRDPQSIEERRVERARQEKLKQEAAAYAQAQVIPNARAFLLSLDIGHKTGWSRKLAEHLGIHYSDTKRWLKKNLPRDFARLYPGGKMMAQKLG